MPSTAVPSDPHSKLWDVGKETELRILCRGTAVVVTLQKGVAEVFGAEMKMLMPYTFHDTSVAIFSWYGAQIKVTHVVEDASNSASAASSSGSSSALATLSSSAAAAGTGSHGDESEASFFVYEEARSHMMQDYVQLHGKVDEIRVDALSDAEVGGPRVIVIGPPNSGKSSLVRLLCSYAVRMSRAPLFVDLDTGAGDASMPGSIVASPVDMRCVSVERGLLARYPLAFYYGHSSPTANADLFKHQVDALSKVVERCLEKNQALHNSGIIVNACAWGAAGGASSGGTASARDVLVHAVKALKCNVIVVVKNDRMFSEMHAEFDPELTVLKVPQSGGVEEIGDSRRRSRQQARIRRYFYGDPHRKKYQLAPALLTISFDDVTIVRVGDDRDDKASQAMTPLGQEHLMKVDPFRVRPVDPSNRGSGILHAVLGVSHASKPEEVTSANVAGYVWVRGLDTQKRTIDVLQPNHIDFLKGKVLVLGSFTFIDRDH